MDHKHPIDGNEAYRKKTTTRHSESWFVFRAAQLAHQIEPVITLSHFEMPYHLVTKYGAWRNRKLIDFFVRFGEVVMERYKDKGIDDL